MGRGKKLTDLEKGQILAYRSQGKGLRWIGREIHRSRKVILNYLNNPDSYGLEKSTGRPRKLSERAQRRIINEASNTTKSCRQLSANVEPHVSRQTIWRILNRAPNIFRSKLRPVPRLLPRHKSARLEFARLNMDRNWEKVIFSDEKKWNLDGPDGFNSYWRDLRKEEQYFSKRNFCGGSLMVWGAISSNGCLELQFPSTKMNSKEYITVLQCSLTPFLRQNFEMQYVFQQDNASVHVSKETKSWFESECVEVLNWPACSPDMNPIENIWGILVRRVYANNRQFDTISNLKTAIIEEWDKIDQKLLKTLINGMKARIFELIQKAGNATHY